MPAERTIAERITKVDAVAVIRVLGPERTRAIDIAPFIRADNPGMEMPAMVDVYTEQDVIVTEALRSHSSVITGGTVTLSRAGGCVSAATGDFFTKATSVELVPDGPYNALLGVWEAHPFDVFGLDGARVGLTANSSLTGYGQQLGKLTPAQAIEAIRRTSPRN